MARKLNQTETSILTNVNAGREYHINTTAQARAAYRLCEDGLILLVRPPKQWAHRGIRCVAPSFVPTPATPWVTVTKEFLSKQWELAPAVKE